MIHLSISEEALNERNRLDSLESESSDKELGQPPAYDNQSESFSGSDRNDAEEIE